MPSQPCITVLRPTWFEPICQPYHQYILSSIHITCYPVHGAERFYPSKQKVCPQPLPALDQTSMPHLCLKELHSLPITSLDTPSGCSFLGFDSWVVAIGRILILLSLPDEVIAVSPLATVPWGQTLYFGGCREGGGGQILITHHHSPKPSTQSRYGGGDAMY